MLHAACRTPVAEREDFLRRSWQSDSLRSEVAALLTCDNVEGNAFDEGWLSSPRWSGQLEDARENLSATSRPGQLVGDFRLDEEIGRGGMAIVFRARQTSSDRPVALKVLPIPFTTAAGRERFRREAEVGRRLHHEHIVTVYEYAEHDGVQVCAMELVEGRTLDPGIPAPVAGNPPCAFAAPIL